MLGDGLGLGDELGLTEELGLEERLVDGLGLGDGLGDRLGLGDGLADGGLDDDLTDLALDGLVVPVRDWLVVAVPVGPTVDDVPPAVPDVEGTLGRTDGFGGWAGPPPSLTRTVTSTTTARTPISTSSGVDSRRRGSGSR